MVRSAGRWRNCVRRRHVEPRNISRAYGYQRSKGHEAGRNRMPDVTRVDADARRRFEEVMLPHLDGVFRLAMWLVGNRSEAEDIVQETFVQALTSFQRFEPGTNARAWLLSIMRHVRAKRLRNRRHAPIEEDAAENIAQAPAVDQTPQHVTDAEVLEALADLPVHFQEVVLLSDVEELSYREIASVLDIPIGTVMSRLHRARRMLRVALAEYAASCGIGTRAHELSKDKGT
jgi:RNA polymerase sigma-70 factor (ECF subfamily)